MKPALGVGLNIDERRNIRSCARKLEQLATDEVHHPLDDARDFVVTFRSHAHVVHAGSRQSSFFAVEIAAKIKTDSTF